MREELRKYVEGGLGRLTPRAAQDLAQSLVRGEGRERIGRAAQDLLAWSSRSRERLAELIQREVRKQLKAVGVVTREDLDSVRKRVRDLERAAGAQSGRSTAKASAGSVGKDVTRKTTTTGKPTTRKSRTRA